MISDPGIRVCSLASGSRGNALYVEAGGTAVLVDAGLSGVELERRMSQRGLNPEALSAVVISHEHTDHTLGAGVLSRRFKIPVYINPDTYEASQKKLGTLTRVHHFRCGEDFSIGALRISPFSISHDAADPAGFTLARDTLKVGVATDLGVATHLVKSHLDGCSLVFIEANHDPAMLETGPYPWHLKQRVKGRLGHLSNGDAGDLVSDIMGPRLSHVILSHLSQENNTPETARHTFCSRLNRPGIRVDVALPHAPGRLIHLMAD